MASHGQFCAVALGETLRAGCMDRDAAQIAAALDRRPGLIPGYYNNEGQAPTPIQRLAVGYPAGASAYFRYLDAWRATDDFTGLEFR